MRNRLLLFSAVCLLVFLMSGCHTSRKAVAHSSRQPKFIDDVYMKRHKRSNVMACGSSKGSTIETGHNKTDAVVLLPLSKKEISTIRKKYAGIMSMSPKDLSDNNLYEFIDEWYGTDYHLGGGDRKGIDCSGFAKKLYATVYGADLSRTAAEQYANCKKIHHSGDENEGDLVFFRVHGKHITHVGVYLGNDYFVHASSSQGVIISNLKEDYWRKYYVGAGR